MYNFLTNIETCYWDVPNLLYYSHIPALTVSLVFGLYILKNTKSSDYLMMSIFWLTLLTDFLLISNIFVWVNKNASVVIFTWIIVLLVYYCIPFIAYRVSRLFLSSTKNFFWSDILLLISLPIYSLFILSKTYLGGFEYNSCELIENSNYQTYIITFTYALFFLLIIANIFRALIKKSDINTKKAVTISVFGLLFFLANFFFIFQISYFSENYNLELYAFLGLPIFIALLSYSIIKYKILNIKLLGAQALMWTIALLVGSQLFFIKTTTNFVLTGFTLLIVAGAGFFLVRSVKKVDEQRELLEIANNNQQSLIHFISHQLKGFFTKSKMIFAGVLEGDFGEQNPMTLEMAKTGLASDDNAVAMIQNILGASNLKTGVTSYNFKNINLTEIIKKIVSIFDEEMGKKGLVYEKNITNDPLVCFADETQIDQVFKNLIDNSLHYTPTGKIEVSLGVSPENNNKILFTVKDTGVGLSESDKAKLFTEGGKGEESLKVNTNSTGYGLYIVKKIVEGHRGRIWAESEGRGHGSKFCVELDLVR